MSLIKWTDKTLFPSLNSAFDDFFKDDDGFFSAVSKGTTMPAVNTSETHSSFELEIAAPGKVKDDFKLELENNVLSISSESEDESSDNEKNYTRKEYNYSSFFRSFRLPENVDGDNIKATYMDGILKISILKDEASIPETRSIPIG